MNTRDLTAGLHPVFADALRPMFMPLPDSRAVLVAALREACDAIEANARHAFVVCGQPDTQEGFERAWQCEDEADYARWKRLCATVRKNEGSV